MIKTKCYQDSSQWHEWFAWHPITIRLGLQGSRYCCTKVWWEKIERKSVYTRWGGYCWDYRLIK